MKYPLVLKREVFSASIYKISCSETCETTGCDWGQRALIRERFITFITGTVGLKTEKNVILSNTLSESTCKISNKFSLSTIETYTFTEINYSHNFVRFISVEVFKILRFI